MARKRPRRSRPPTTWSRAPPTVDAQNQLALLLLTYYRGIDTGRKMEQAKAEGR